MYRILLVLASFILSVSVAHAHYPGSYVDGEKGETDLEFPYDPVEDVMGLKMIFVAFPGFDNTITYEIQGHYQEMFEAYVEELSRSKLTIHPESSILLPPPGQVLDETNTSAQTWIADLSPEDYIDSANLNADNYDYYFLNQNPWNLYADTANYASPICAEILYKIWIAYKDDEDEDLFPTEPGEEGKWELHFFFMAPPEVLGVDLHGPYKVGVGGRPFVHVYREKLQLQTGDFFDNLFVYNDIDLVAGSGCRMPDTTWLESHAEDTHPHSWMRTFIHEWVHTLGIQDGPPGLGGIQGHESKYHWGNLNIVGQSFAHLNEDCTYPNPPFKGISPLADSHLPLLPWYTETDPENPSLVENVTGKSLRSHKIYSTGSEGKIYRYDLGPHPSRGDEYFIFAYHSGDGLDDQGYEDNLGNPVATVPGRGLAVWHCLGRSDHLSMVDLESAHGLFDYKTINRWDFVPYWTDETVEAAKDEESGYDNYDLWADGENVRRDDCSFDGDDFDFFNVSDIDTLNRPLFNWTTNPNTNRYSTTGTPLRRRPQNIKNPFSLEVLSSGSDNQGDFLFVDILNGPSEKIESIVPESGGFHVTMETSFADVLIDYSVLFSTNGGGNYRHIVLEDVVFDAEAPSFFFATSDALATNNGKLKILFKNTIDTSIVGYFESESSIIIPGTILVRGDIVHPVGGQMFEAGTENSIVWRNSFTDGNGAALPIDKVVATFIGKNPETEIALGTFYSPNTGMTPAYSVTDVEAGIELGEIPFNITSEMCCDNARIKLEFNPDSVLTTEVSAEPFTVVLPKFKLVAEESPEPGNLGHGVDYVGSPKGIVVFDDREAENGHQRTEAGFFVAIGDRPDQELSKIYFSRGGNDGCKFTNETGGSFLFGQHPMSGYTCIAGAKLDDGHSLEIFLGHPEYPLLLQQNSDRKFVDILNDNNCFASDEIDLLKDAHCATWFDYGHDGDLDLYIGKNGRDSLFENISTTVGGLSFVNNNEPTRFLFSSDLTSSVNFVDIDVNGLWDVIRSSPNGVVHYEENSGGDFDDKGMLRSTSGSPRTELGDFDKNGLLDVVVFGIEELKVFNKGHRRMELLISASGRNLSDAGVVEDLDLDGYPDLVVAKNYDIGSSEIFINMWDDENYSTKLHPVGDYVGIAPGGEKVWSIAVADFDIDGDMDIILGSEGIDQRVMRNVTYNGLEASDRKWLKIKLIGDGEDNYSGVGAIVTVSNPTNIDHIFGTQTVSGSSGTSSQGSSTLTFGLGDYVGDVFVSVRWPLGLVYEFLVQSDDLCKELSVSQDVGFQIKENSVQVVLDHDLDTGMFLWTFYWETDRYTSAASDYVDVTPPFSGNCGSGANVGGAGFAEPVKYILEEIDGRVEIGFLHCVKYSFQGCFTNCHYTYSVSSADVRGNEVVASQTYPTSINILGCPKDIKDINNDLPGGN